jgi:hypothetical protein
MHSRARLCSGQNGTLPVLRVTTQRQRLMARFYSCAQAQADGLTTTAGLATSRERNATMTIRVRQDEAQGSKATSCPFLGLLTRGHKVNLDRDTTAGRRAAVRSRRDRERSVLTTHCSVRMTTVTTSGDSQAGCARAVDGSGTCRRKARLEGRHTSDAVCAAARSKQPHVQPGLSGLARFPSTARRPAHRAGEGTRHAHLGVLVATVNGNEELQHKSAKRSDSGNLPNRWWSAKQYELSQHTGGSSFSFTMSRASMAAEALRSSRFTASASLRSSSGFVGRRLQSSRTRWSRRETRRRGPCAGGSRLPRRPQQVDDSGTATSSLPPPPAPPSSTRGSPAAPG